MVLLHSRQRLPMPPTHSTPSSPEPAAQSPCSLPSHARLTQVLHAQAREYLAQADEEIQQYGTCIPPPQPPALCTRLPEVVHAHARYDQAQAQEVQQYCAYTQRHCCQQCGKGVAPVDECVEALEHCCKVV